MNYEQLSGKSVRLLGKTRALNAEEFETLLKLHQIALSRETDPNVSLVIEGRMMNPLEQQESDRAYEERIAPIIGIDALEEWLCRSIEPERLLMSLKLSKDRERLVDFIRNPYITDGLFFKLLKLYDWQGEGLFDNDTNRDVTAALISRYYKDPEKNHNVQYAMSGLAHLIERYGTAELIDAIAEFPPIREAMKNSNERSLNGVLNSMAIHPNTPRKVLLKLLESHKELLAQRVPLDMETELLKSGDAKIEQILACNPALSAEGIRALEERYADLLAANITLNDEWFERWKECYAVELASNPSLKPDMQRTLMESGVESVIRALAANSSLEEVWLVKLYEIGGYECELSSNSALDPKRLEALYHQAANEVAETLASNPSTPVEILYQLSLDQRYERSVKMNPSFGKYIQTHNIGWQL